MTQEDGTHIGRYGAGLMWLLPPVLAVAAYLAALDAPFIFDDRTEILENASIRSLRDVAAVLLHNPTRPIVNLSYALDYSWWSLDPFGYHLTNVLLHAINVLLLFTVVRGMVGDAERRGGRVAQAQVNGVAFVAAGIFAVHPMMTEAVTYISSRSELLSAMLFLAAFQSFRAAFVRASWRWYAAGLVLFAATLAAKETGAMLPFVLLAYDRLVLRDAGAAPRSWRRWSHALLIGLVLVAGAARASLYLMTEHPDAAWFQSGNALVAVDAIARYVALLLVPVSQSLVHPLNQIGSFVDQRALTSLASLLVLGGAAVWAWRREPLVTFGIIWFALVLIPSSSLILLADRGQPMAEHRVYLASCGFLIAAAAGAWTVAGLGDVRRPTRLAAGMAALAVVLASLTGLTTARNRLWGDPVALWNDAARKAPLTYAAQYGLADAYFSVGDCDAAVGAYRRAIALRPENADAYLGLAACQRDLARPDEARQTLRAGLATARVDPRVILALASLEESRQNAEEALRLCQQLLASGRDVAAAQTCVARNAEALTPRR